MNAFNVKIIGCNAVLPMINKMTTCQVVTHNNTPFLIDCAENTQVELRKHKIPFGKLNDIFISHIHGDHIYGLFGLVSTLNLLGRKNDLNIYAPSSFNDIYKMIIKLNNNQLRYKLNFIKITETNNCSKIFENKHIEVFAIPLQHSVSVYSYVFKEKEKELNIRKDVITEYNLTIQQIKDIKNGADLVIDDKIIKNKLITKKAKIAKTYMFCTDTLPLYDLNKYGFSPDVLYHESTFLQKDLKLASQTMHSTALQAAEVAMKLNAKKLILGHFSSRYKDLKQFELEAKTIFDNTIIAYDGMSINL